jgi:Metallo-beta-lactamase superfamily
MRFDQTIFSTLAALLCLACPTVQSAKPEWCRKLPRPEYGKLEKVDQPDAWFDVYRIRPGVFAIYEPHQSEEVISYLVLGKNKGVLFDTGMGISNIRNVVDHLTKLPVSVINSHTHNDHVGDNWRFNDIYVMDT